MSDKIVIKPIKLIDYSCKQSKSKVLPRLPLRGILLAPSGSGKSVMLASMLLEANMYRGCFERIYIFSPSIHVDQTWQAVKDYQEKVMNVEETETAKLYFDHYDPEDLQNIIDTQHKVILEMKKRKLTKLFSIAIIINDFSDDANFSRHSKLLHSLFTRGRHNSKSTLVSTQKFASIAQIVRINATFLIVFRLRNNKDLECFLDEISGLAERKELLEMYTMATQDPYSFLYCNLVAPKLNDMFYIRFDKQIKLE
mgnify:CR=1 FL=1